MPPPPPPPPPSRFIIVIEEQGETLGEVDTLRLPVKVRPYRLTVATLVLLFLKEGVDAGLDELLPVKDPLGVSLAVTLGELEELGVSENLLAVGDVLKLGLTLALPLIVTGCEGVTLDFGERLGKGEALPSPSSTLPGEWEMLNVTDPVTLPVTHALPVRRELAEAVEEAEGRGEALPEEVTLVLGVSLRRGEGLLLSDAETVEEGVLLGQGLTVMGAVPVAPSCPAMGDPLTLFVRLGSGGVAEVLLEALCVDRGPVALAEREGDTVEQAVSVALVEAVAAGEGERLGCAVAVADGVPCAAPPGPATVAVARALALEQLREVGEKVRVGQAVEEPDTLGEDVEVTEGLGLTPELTLGSTCVALVQGLLLPVPGGALGLSVPDTQAEYVGVAVETALRVKEPVAVP